MSNDTKLSISLECDDLIDGLDKAAAKIARFSETAKSAIDAVDKKTKSMSETEQRAYDVLKRSYEKHSNAIKEMAKEYEALRSKRKSGADMTASEWAQLKTLTAEYKKHSGALATVSKELGGMEKATSKFKSIVDVKSATSSAVGGIAAIVSNKLVSLLWDFADSVVTVGLKTQQTAAQFSAMANSVSDGTVAYQAFNDVARNTNYDFDAVYEMGKQLLNMGYSAKNAADLIQLCSDTAAALGTGQNGAAELVKTISMIQTAGKMEEDQLAKLQMAGINVDVVFSKLGLTGVETMQALRDGSLDGKDAVAALTDYMHQFDGAMAKSKDNITDLWGDVAGNVATACGEIGAGIADAFKQSEILQDLVDFTQSFIDLVRGEGCGAWQDFKAVAQAGLNVIADALQVVYTMLKLGVIITNEVYEAFKTMCQKVYDRLQTLLKPMSEVWRILSGVVSLTGETIKMEVDKSFKETFVQQSLPEEENQFRAGLDRSSSGKTSSKTTKAASPLQVYEAQAKSITDAYNSTADAIRKTEDANKKLQAARDALTLATLDGEAKKQAQYEISKSRIAETQELDNKATADKISYLQNLVALWTEAAEAGVDGSQKKLDTLAEQITKEEELLAIRQQTTDLQMQTIEDGAVAEKLLEQEAIVEQVRSAWLSYGQSVASGFGDAVGSIVDGSKTASQAMGELLRSIINNVVTTAAQFAALCGMLMMFGVVPPGPIVAKMMFGVNSTHEYKEGSLGAKLSGHAAGGYITGAGTSTSDSIPAMLSNGEYVINARAVRAIGIGTLDMINSGRLPAAKFANGGLVGDAVAGYGAASAGNNIVLNVSTLDAASFDDALRNGGLLQSIKQALFDSDRDFAGKAGVW